MVKVEEATADLRDLIASFQVAMAQETENLSLDLPTVKKGVQAVFDDPAKGRYFIAYVEGKPVASLLITYEWSDWRNGNMWWIQSVYVKAEYRAKGVYKHMYKHLQQMVNDDPDLAGLRLYVDLTNKKAQAVYEALGMNGNHYQLFEWMKA